jgi:hypothetical protein
VTVDRLAGDVKGLGDLRDGVAPFAVGALLVIHLPGHGDLPRGEFGFAAAGSSACSGGFEAFEVPSLIRSASISSIAPMTWNRAQNSRNYGRPQSSQPVVADLRWKSG